MITKLHVNEPKDIKFTLTLTMTLSEWTNLRNQIDPAKTMASPAWEISQEVQSMVEQAEKSFYPKQ